MVSLENTHLMFSALGDATRLEIVSLLSKTRSMRVSDIAGQFEMTRPAISKHLNILDQAGLVNAKRVGREKLYELRPDALGKVSEWANRHQRLWDAALGDLKAHFEEKRTEGGKDDRS
ncbi:metalloregulator ArsR/SmtB family transcription factor [uncultured Tateyamaria sp.]|uniref:ArsR/SmtB family transcription factor n=1 Tax=uncultured Tateyamaria sp. TaxID=455651 RepID=UPI002607D913|nr:metalloregulator ArsR/SmtB family transcription factor [uncultured Tateyamaria sp.]